MKFPSFTPEQNLSIYRFKQIFNPKLVKKIKESNYNVEYDADWLLDCGIKDITDAQSHIRKIYAKSKNGEFSPLLVSSKQQGRYFYTSSLSLGLICCPFRHSICKDLYVDFDMVNAHYKILEQLCIQNEYTKTYYKYISQYVQKRDQIRQKLSKQYFPNESFSTAKDKIKTLFLRMMYLGSFDKWRVENGLDEKVKQDTYTTHIQNEIIYIIAQLKVSNPLLWGERRKAVEKENKQTSKWNEKNGTNKPLKNPDSSFLSLFLQSWERKIVETVVPLLKEKQYITDNVFVYTFDGFMLLKNDALNTSAMCKELYECVKSTLGLEIHWETKDFDKHIDDKLFPPPKVYTHVKEKLKTFDFNYFEEIISYEEKKDYFERFICKTILPQPLYWFKTFENEDTQRYKYHFFSKEHLKEVFQEYTLNEAKTSNNKVGGDALLFIDKWLKDPEKRQYEFQDFNPVPHAVNNDNGNTRVLNTFCGYSPTCFRGDLIYDKKTILKPFMRVLQDLLGGSEEDMEAFNMLIAHKIQHPHVKKPFAILIKSLEGEGKNTICDRIGAIFGREHYFYSANANDVIGTHAEAIQNKLLVVLNEMGINQTKEHTNKFKSLISEDRWTINPKNIRPMEIKNLGLIVVLSNEDNPIYIDQRQGDRRWFIFEGNRHNSNIPEEIWSKIHKHIRTEEFTKALYDFYMGLDCEKYNYRDARIKNSRKPAYKNVVCRYVKPEILFLNDYICERRFVGFDKNPLNTENKFVNWKGFDADSTNKYNHKDLPEEYHEFDKHWYEDDSFINTKFFFKAKDLLDDYHTWIKMNRFSIERNEKSSKAFINSIMSLNLDIEKSKDHNNLTLLAFNPHSIIKKMLLNNYIELEDNIVQQLTQTYEVQAHDKLKQTNIVESDYF